jgi:type VI secretion system protein VasD
MITKLKLTVLAIISLVFVNACASGPTTVSMNFIASADTNGGLPVKVTVFYLSSTSKFNSADYFTLASNPQAALGAELLKVGSVLLSPGQSKSLNATFDAGGPVAVGVIVGFKAIDSAKWNATASVKSGSENLLTVGVTSASVSISK